MTSPSGSFELDPAGPYSLAASASSSKIAEPWRPYRTWVSVLLRSFLEDETHEIAHAGR